MKTAAEKAREYADETYPTTDSNDYSRTTAEEWDACYDGYMAGYAEAMRWRDPKEELPEEDADVFVKVIRSGEYGDETIYTSSRVVNDFYHSNDADPFGCEGYYPAGNGGRVRVTVIGWRPTE